MSNSVLRTAGAIAIAAGCCCFAAPDANAEQWLFERIVQTGDTLPNQPGEVITSFFSVLIDGDNVVYRGVTTNKTFIGGRINGIRRTIADTATPAPEGLGVFTQLFPTAIQDSTVFFTGRDSRGGFVNTGVFRYRPANMLKKIVDLGDAVPGDAGAAFVGFFDAQIDEDKIYYEGETTASSIPGDIFLDNGGAQSLLFADDSVLPDGASMMDLILFEHQGGALLVAGYTQPAATGRAIYRYATEGNERLAIEGDLVDNGAIGELFSEIDHESLDSNGKTAVFRGIGSMGANGLYGADGGLPWKILDKNDFAPPAFVDHFTAFSSLDADQGAMVFIASKENGGGQERLYYTLNYELNPTSMLVLQPGDMLDGKTVSGFGTIGRQTLSGHTIVIQVAFDDASRGIYTATLTQDSMETEPNNSPDTANCIEILSDCVFINGKLQPNEFPGCDPDTVLVAFDKQLNFLEDASGVRLINDDDAAAGDGRGSALWDIPLVPNGGPGTGSTLRLGVTGSRDVFEGMGGSNGDFNGLFENVPHGQLGQFTLTVTFVDDMGDPLPDPAMLPDGSLVANPIEYVEEFRSGGEAFYLNFIAPVGADAAHAVVDNTTGRVEYCNDVDFFEFKNLIPGCPYCVIQVGGLDEQCQQTDGLLAWYDKDGAVILTDDNSGEGVFASLCDPDLAVVADVNGVIRIAFTGSGDNNFNGLKDGPDEIDYLTNNPAYAIEYPGLVPTAFDMGQHSGQALGRAVDLVCADPPPAHGVCGCYTLKVMLDANAHDDPPFVLTIENAMSHGDINMDGITNTADLGIMLGSFGWESP
jgi:hypothetical protein